MTEPMSSVQVKVDVENNGGTAEIHVTSGQPGSSTDEQNSKKLTQSGSSSVHKELEVKESEPSCKAGKSTRAGEKDSMDVDSAGTKSNPCEKDGSKQCDCGEVGWIWHATDQGEYVGLSEHSVSVATARATEGH